MITSAVGTHRITLDLHPIKGHMLEPYRGAPMLEEPTNNGLSSRELHVKIGFYVRGLLLLLLLLLFAQSVCPSPV